jgi:hypothetical protein
MLSTSYIEWLQGKACSAMASAEDDELDTLASSSSSSSASSASAGRFDVRGGCSRDGAHLVRGALPRQDHARRQCVQRRRTSGCWETRVVDKNNGARRCLARSAHAVKVAQLQDLPPAFLAPLVLLELPPGVRWATIERHIISFLTGRWARRRGFRLGFRGSCSAEDIFSPPESSYLAPMCVS